MSQTWTSYPSMTTIESMSIYVRTSSSLQQMSQDTSTRKVVMSTSHVRIPKITASSTTDYGIIPSQSLTPSFKIYPSMTTKKSISVDVPTSSYLLTSSQQMSQDTSTREVVMSTSLVRTLISKIMASSTKYVPTSSYSLFSSSKMDQDPSISKSMSIEMSSSGRGRTLIATGYRLLIFYHCLYYSVPRYHCFYDAVPRYHCFYDAVPRYHCLYYSVPRYHCFYYAVPRYHCLYYSVPRYHCFYYAVPTYHCLYYSVPRYHCFYYAVPRCASRRRLYPRGWGETMAIRIDCWRNSGCCNYTCPYVHESHTK